MKHAMRMTWCAAVMLCGAAMMPARADVQVLATVGRLQVTADDLKTAMASAPFSNKFPSMDEHDQARLRGDMLRRLVVAKLLMLEAQRLGVDKTATYRKEQEEFRRGLLYRAYMEKLRQEIVIPKETLAAMQKQFKQDRDGMEAAKAAYVSERYRELQRGVLLELLRRDNVKIHEERIAPGIRPDTVLAAGRTLKVRYDDLVDPKQFAKSPDAAWLKNQLSQRVELMLGADAASRQGIDVSADMKKYAAEHLPAIMMETKTKEWIPGERTLRDWYEKHPEAATVPERRHVGQLVVATRQEAEALRARILKGESLFTLAGQYSVEPLSRKQNGDIGWVVAGRGLPELDRALARLKDNETSEVIAVGDGTFHLLTILERVPGRKETYDRMRERIAQSIVNEKLPPYVAALEKQYGVKWNVLQPAAAAQAAK